MVKRSQRLPLLDMQREIGAVEAALAKVGAAHFETDWLLRNAVERGIEIISEASRHLDPALAAMHPDVPWRRVADIGNWLRHAYERVDPSLIWFIVVDEFPALKASVTAMLQITPDD